MPSSIMYAPLTFLAVAAITWVSAEPLENSFAHISHEEYFQLRHQRHIMGGEELFHEKRETDDISVNKKSQIFRPIGPVIGPNIPYCSSNNELCCGNKVFRGQFDYGAQCCGEDYYDTSTARCCDNRILLANDYNLQCCGKKLYNQTKQVCCNGKAHDIQKNQQCCDTSVYNVLTQICCNGTVLNIDNEIVSCCDKQSYEPSTSHCIKGVIIVKQNPAVVTQICGNQVIDYNTNICCDDQPQDRTDGEMTVCCGTEPISAATQLCCNGSVISNLMDNAQCCVKNVFDPNKQVCCNGHVYERPENSVGAISYCNSPAIMMSAAIAYSPHFECCGDHLFTNYDQQLCCSDELYNYDTSNEKNMYSCCASTAYLSSDQTCCSDTLVQGSNRRCCDKQPYDLNKKVCCANHLFPHNGVPHDLCCSGSPVLPFPIFDK